MTEHPLLAELQARFDAILEQQPDAKEEQLTIEREGKTGHGDRGIPLFDGNRGMPNGCTIAGTRPGDPLWELERANRDVADSIKRKRKR